MLDFTRGLGVGLLVLLIGGCGSKADQASGQEPVFGDPSTFTQGCTKAPACGTCGSCSEQCLCVTQDVGYCASACAQSGGGGALPCNIDTLVKSRCQSCHGAKPLGGAPMSLLTAADFQRDWVVRTTESLIGQHIKLSELARIRINGERGTAKMPQGNPLPPADLSTLTSWLSSGAPAGAACGAPPPPPPGGGANAVGGSNGQGGANAVGGSNGQGGSNAQGGTIGYGGASAAGGTAGAPPTASNVITPNTTDECANDPTQFQPLVARPGETCYEFRTHGVSSTTDQTKFTIQPGQSYNQFYFDVPWPAGSIATRFGARFDNLSVLHHWLGFSSTSANAAGTVLTNVTGTTLGEGAELIGGWAVGGCNVDFSDEMGLKLPDTGKIMIQWHHFNSTGAPAQDGTAVQFCVVPAAQRKNIGGLTFLGTENFNGLAGMPAGKTSTFSGTCTNNSGKPITIVGYTPHMHLLGTNMKSEVQRANGTKETAFDHPFLFDHQVNYILKPGSGYVLQPGDKITSTCTFDNTTTAPVAFGQSTKAEMCYQFTIAYPYGALNNGVFSLIGATNTCW
jgi:hypothetical protein